MAAVNWARNLGTKYKPRLEPVAAADGPLGIWYDKAGYESTQTVYASPAAGDLDGDGAPDVVIGSADNVLLYYARPLAGTADQARVGARTDKP